MFRILLQLAVAAFAPQNHSIVAPCAAPISGRLIPTDFVAGRVFARWHLQGRGDLRLYTDTGGGGILLYAEAVRRLGLAVDTITSVREPVMIATIPHTLGDSLFPRILGGDATTDKLLVSEDPPPEDEAGHAWDGRLGSVWFGGQVWTFDFPNRRLYFNGTAPTGPTDPKCWVPLGFQADSAGRRTTQFPRITAQIDGEPIQFLLDTGARTQLAATAWPAIEPREPKYRATSFITTDRFEQWHTRHPEWLVVPHAEEGADSSAMIRVPTIEVGGQKIGPVWFTERPNRSFHDFMSQYRDQPVEGALGGSAWRYVTLIVDYPRARAAVMPIAAR